MWRPRQGLGPLGLAALFTASGSLHLLRPDIFLPLVPRGLPAPHLIVTTSGVAELACAVGLAAQLPWAGPASAALLAAVLPGNVQFAVDRSSDPATGLPIVVAAWLRLPLQIPLISIALHARRRASGPASPSA